MPPFRVVLPGVVLAFAVAAPLWAQTGTVTGRVADAADNPVPGAVVLLHAVTDAAGTELDRDTADASGAFTLSYAHEEGPLYFVATRVDGEIFMGEPFREPPAGPIVLRAGAGVEPLRMGDAFAGGGAGAGAGAPAERSHAGWWVAVIAVALVGIVAWIVHRTRRRAPRARELLLEIARLDEENVAVGGTGSESYRVRRAELRDRLVEALELDPDADRH